MASDIGMLCGLFGRTEKVLVITAGCTQQAEYESRNAVQSVGAYLDRDQRLDRISRSLCMDKADGFQMCWQWVHKWGKEPSGATLKTFPWKARIRHSIKRRLSTGYCLLHVH
jgi:hypothetical protein